MIKYQIVYVLRSPEERNGLALVTPYLAAYKNDVAVKIEKMALVEVLRSYNIEISNTVHERIFKLCNEISDDEIINKFKPKSRKKIDALDKLLEAEDNIRSLIQKWIGRKLDEILSMIAENGLPFFSYPKRVADLSQFEIKVEKCCLKPNLYFEKTALGIKYKLTLELNNKLIPPSNYNTVVLSNLPAWIMIDDCIFCLDGINGNKLLPFLTKEDVFIPERMTKEYFTKFIIDLVAKVDINTNGFEIMKSTPEGIACLTFSYDFMCRRHVLILEFDYEGVVFKFGENATNRTKLKFRNENEILVHNTTRNDEWECKVVELLKGLGLLESDSKSFYFDGLIEELDFFNRIADCRSKIVYWGMHMDLPFLENKEINLDKFSISSTQLQLKGDWFDIQVEFFVGSELIKFSQLSPYIKKNERLFPLSDGKYFVIPSEWMNKFKSISVLADIRNGNVSLKKHHQNILDQISEFSDKLAEYRFSRFSKPDEIQATLRPYQEDGASWMAEHLSNGLGVCLADDMGLGKTLQTITALVFVYNELYRTNLTGSDGGVSVQLSIFDTFANNNTKRNYMNALVVVPASLIHNWYAEVKKFTPDLRVLKYVGDKKERRISVRKIMDFDFVITTYNYLLSDLEEIKAKSFRFLVLDESQRIKNNQSKIFKAISSLTIPHRVSLSGTPIENSLKDLWSQMQFINPELLGSFEFFKSRYLLPIEKGEGESVLQELKTIIQPYLLRRTKKEVLQDLPDCVEQVYYCEMTTEHHELYEKEKSAARNEILNLNDQSAQSRFHVLSFLSKLRLLANHPTLYDSNSEVLSSKFLEVVDFLDVIIKSGSKVLVFSSFVKHLEIFADYFRENKIPYVQLSGGDSLKDREKAINTFNGDERVSIFLISLKAGGVGLNLTAADNVVILDPWWNPFAELQAIGRAHRIGQENKVVVTRFITKATIEEKIINLQHDKLAMANEILTDEPPTEMSLEELKLLIVAD